MSMLTKVLVVLVSVMSIALSALFVGAAAQWGNYKAISVELADQRNAALAENAMNQGLHSVALAREEAKRLDAERARDEALSKANSLSEEARALRLQNADLETKLAKAEADRTKMTEVVSLQASENATLKKQNDTFLSENIDLQSRNQQLSARNFELTTELTIREDELRNLRERYAGSTGTFGGSELGAAEGYSQPIASTLDLPEGVATLSSVQATPNMQGEIVEVMGNYASVNVGQASGVSRGMVAMVFRGKQYLADLVIDKVHPGEAGGKLTTRVGDVRAGDRVQFIQR
ncbi:MAG: hypothetical protein AB7N71_13850 [Phycisphaerae bacterium]